MILMIYLRYTMSHDTLEAAKTKIDRLLRLPNESWIKQNYRAPAEQ